MSIHGKTEAPRAGPTDKLIRESIIRFWHELSMSGSAGATTWEVLDPIQARVTECLMASDLLGASHWTAKALSLIEGT